MEKKQEIFNLVKAKHELVKAYGEEYGYQYVLMTVLIGSQNYCLDTADSDVDTYSYVLPSYLNFITNSSPLISKEISLADSSKAYIRDIRLGLNSLRKSSPNSVECFLSAYKVYDPFFDEVLNNYLNNDDTLFYLTHCNYKNMIDAIAGTVSGLHGRNMSLGKKYAHALRLKNLLDKYLNISAFPSQYLIPDPKVLEIAFKAKNYPENFTEEKLKQKYEEIRDDLNTFKKYYQVSEVEKGIEYLTAHNIDRLEYKLFDKYFELNGLVRRTP